MSRKAVYLQKPARRPTSVRFKMPMEHIAARAVEETLARRHDSLYPENQPPEPPGASLRVSYIEGPLAGAEPVARSGLAVRGVEVVQAIQSLDHHVRLIAEKATVVRVYLDPTQLMASAHVTGELAWRRGSGGFAYLPAMNRVVLSPQNALDLTAQRFKLEHSLNFRLPPQAVAAGDLELTLHRLFVPGAEEIPIATPMRSVLRFDRAPPLRVRVIGLRYRRASDPGTPITPNAIHFAYLKSYLERAYPVARVEWSQLVVDADLLTAPFDAGASDRANAQLAALRSREISSGMDPRTHYYGLVDNDQGQPGSFMRGSAMYNTLSGVFGPIASGPAGVPTGGWVGDFDGSFADWYGAHELGHTFQRRHPGFPEGEQPQDPLEMSFPYPHGRISSPDERFVGFDVGDPTLGLPMSALPGNVHHDVMTYADSQWLSAYTYEGIYQRLLAEESEFAPVL